MEVVRGIAVAELRRRASQGVIEAQYLDGALISPKAVSRRKEMEERIAYLKAGMLDSFGGLAPNELDALATEVESLLIGGLR